MTENEETGLRRSCHTAQADTTKLNATSNQIFKLCLLNQPSLRGFCSRSFFLSFVFLFPFFYLFFFTRCHSAYVLLFRFTTARFVRSLARSLDPVFQQEVNGQVCSCPTAAELTIRLGSQGPFHPTSPSPISFQPAPTVTLASNVTPSTTFLATASSMVFYPKELDSSLRSRRRTSCQE